MISGVDLPLGHGHYSYINTMMAHPPVAFTLTNEHPKWAAVSVVGHR
jgi:hypothetical protein